MEHPDVRSLHLLPRVLHPQPEALDHEHRPGTGLAAEVAARFAVELWAARHRNGRIVLDSLRNPRAIVLPNPGISHLPAFTEPILTFDFFARMILWPHALTAIAPLWRHKVEDCSPPDVTSTSH